MSLGPLMVVTSQYLPPAIEPLRIKTAKVFFLKTVSSYAALILTSSIRFVDGKDQHRTFGCMKKRLLMV
jgi:hypothetical protein